MAALGQGHFLRRGGGGAVDRQLWWLQLGLLGAAAILGLLAGIDPKLAVVGALGLVFVFLVISDLAIGMALFAVISFLDVLPFGGAAVTFAKATGLLLALAWLAVIGTSERGQRNFLVDHTTMSFVLLAFVGWATISTAWAESPAHSLESAYRFALNASLFLIVYTAVQSREQGPIPTSSPISLSRPSR
jgi:hypothetical protein